MIAFLPFIAIRGQALPHLILSKFFQANKSVVQHYLGTAYKQRRGPGFVFNVKGFDTFWVSDFGPNMSGLACQLSSSCSREQALACLGLSSKNATIRNLPIGPAAIATRRNVCVITGVAGLPADVKTHKPWKVNYEEVGIINTQRQSALRSQIENATGAARIDLIKRCYDWRPAINIGH